MSVRVIALYKFVPLTDLAVLQSSLLSLCLEQKIKGTLLLAPEGINGTVAGSQSGIDALLDWFARDVRFAGLDYKESFCDDAPFYRMKVKLKREIVTMGVADIDPNECVGDYVDPKDWNQLIQDPDVLLVDTRNDYEYEIGTFKGAINPNTDNFRQFPRYASENIDPRKHKKVAMFCTGGIRCEKATAFVKKLGVEQVFHLKGGILNYLKSVDQDESLWEGDCFVFDNRVSVDHSLEAGNYDLCHGCRRPILESDKQSPLYVKGVSCPYCHDQLTQTQKERFAQRQKQIDLACSRNQVHLGVDPRESAG